MARERLNPGTAKKHAREVQGDERRRREAAEKLRRDFRGYVQENFDLSDRQRRELDRTPPEFHEVAGHACAVAAEKGWEFDLVPEKGSPNLAIELYCKVEGECGIRISGDC
jgi:hypothetical protein